MLGGDDLSAHTRLLDCYKRYAVDRRGIEESDSPSESENAHLEEQAQSCDLIKRAARDSFLQMCQCYRHRLDDALNPKKIFYYQNVLYP